MSNIVIEFTDETLVQTENGIERLVDLLRRPVKPVLWAIKWFVGKIPEGISFHISHKEAKKFSDCQVKLISDGPARLIEVSDWLFDIVKKYGFYWTNLNSFEEAENYGGPECNL